MHMDGANDSGVFTDSSSRNRVFTMGGASSPQIKTTQSVFGGASGFFPASQNRPLSPFSATDLALGSGDFMIEALIYGTGPSYFTGIISWGEQTGQSFYWQIDSTRFFSNGSGVC